MFTHKKISFLRTRTVHIFIRTYNRTIAHWRTLFRSTISTYVEFLLESNLDPTPYLLLSDNHMYYNIRIYFKINLT